MNITATCIVSKAISVCEYDCVYSVQHVKPYLSI